MYTIEPLIEKGVLRDTLFWCGALTCVLRSLTSSINDWNNPPLNPSEHFTPSEVIEILVIVQFCTWSGRPERATFSIKLDCIRNVVGLYVYNELFVLWSVYRPIICYKTDCFFYSLKSKALKLECFYWDIKLICCFVYLCCIIFVLVYIVIFFNKLETLIWKAMDKYNLLLFVVFVKNNTI